MVKLEAGLPNIYGRYSSYVHMYTDPGINAFAVFQSYENYANQKKRADDTGLILDASRCSPVYGRSTTVQPAALTVNYFIRAR